MAMKMNVRARLTRSVMEPRLREVRVLGMRWMRGAPISTNRGELDSDSGDAKNAANSWRASSL